MVLKQLSDEFLLAELLDADLGLMRAGLSLRQRAMKAPLEVIRRHGSEHVPIIVAGAGKGGGEFERLEALFHAFYRPQDTAMGGHIGVFMYRDIFAVVGVPHVFGQGAINILDSVELSTLQKFQIQNEPEVFGALIDQVLDICDVQYGVVEMKPPFADNEQTRRFLTLSQLHLHAAAAVLTGGYDPRGAVQSALLATELALKAGASGTIDEFVLKKRPYSHDRDKLLEAAQASIPGIDGQRIARVLRRQLRYVDNRYTLDQPPRRKVGHLVMGAQFITAEVTRQMSGRNAREGFNRPVPRTYPA